MIIIIDQKRINKKLFLNDTSLKFQKKLFSKNRVSSAYGDEMNDDFWAQYTDIHYSPRKDIFYKLQSH